MATLPVFARRGGGGGAAHIHCLAKQEEVSCLSIVLFWHPPLSFSIFSSLWIALLSELVPAGRDGREWGRRGAGGVDGLGRGWVRLQVRTAMSRTVAGGLDRWLLA